ncbi:MAG: hypothetical protein NT045_06675 [Candidatus Aureabacteria bacterium]|nr:hypothetical protein [Candidatus Auribacterota bacterium]
MPGVYAADEGKVYPFKSAIITYKISGAMQDGTQTLHIDDYGKKTRTERTTTLKIMGMQRKDSSLEIDDGINHYRIDLIAKTGEKSPSFSRRADELLKSMSPAQREKLEAVGGELTSLKINAPVPPDMFTPPSGVTIREGAPPGGERPDQSR